MTVTSIIAAYDAQIARAYSWVPWREPLTIHTGSASGLACRLCVARLGFSPLKDRDRLFQTAEQFEKHMRETHDTCQQHEN